MDNDIAHDQVLPDLSPGALLEVMENPDAFPEIARADLYVQMHKMRVRARSDEMPTSQRMDYMKFLARMGKVDAPQTADNPFANAPGIIITLPGSGQVVGITSHSPRPQERDITPQPDTRQKTAVLP